MILSEKGGEEKFLCGEGSNENYRTVEDLAMHITFWGTEFKN